MLLRNIQLVKINNMKFEIEFTSDCHKLRGDNDGYVCINEEKIYVKSGLPELRVSHIVWHEICHIISFYNRVKSEDEDMSEIEIQRLATGLQSMEFEEIKNAPNNSIEKENELKEGWNLLDRIKPLERAWCEIIDISRLGTGMVVSALWENDNFRYSVGERDYESKGNEKFILWR